MKPIKIKQRKISELNPAEYNPRQLTDKQYKQLKKSLKTFGCVEPVVINSNPMRKDIIVGGHQRCKVWADLGNDTIPTVEVELDEAAEMELNVRLNKNTGEFDFDMLSSYFDMEVLKEWGFQDYEFGMTLDDDMTDDFNLPDGNFHLSKGISEEFKSHKCNPLFANLFNKGEKLDQQIGGNILKHIL